MSDTWKPSVTVAALIERDGRFLLVEEETADGLRINQPAGHLDPGESLIEACVRETLEETAHRFAPSALVGVYLHRTAAGAANPQVTYLRFAFAGTLGEVVAGRRLDDGIVRTLWLTHADLQACRDRHRSPLVMRCVDDYLAGVRHPLTLLHDAAHGEPR
jgi:8-oxo-dGTP pyrophosphatase MutT (NUDIX family)